MRKNDKQFALKMLQRYNNMSRKDEQKLFNSCSILDDILCEGIKDSIELMNGYGFKLLHTSLGTGFCAGYRYVDWYSKREMFSAISNRGIITIEYRKEVQENDNK